jgi:hypothetical protein
MSLHTTRLVSICDELLSNTNRLKAACKKAGDPWPTSESILLINRVLDIRNELSPPPKPQSIQHHGQSYPK